MKNNTSYPTVEETALDDGMLRMTVTRLRPGTDEVKASTYTIRADQVGAFYAGLGLERRAQDGDALAIAEMYRGTDQDRD